MLDRYRKPGGFNQLLSLLETCGTAKQEKFLQIIKEQDAAWAEAIELRLLTIARIFTWKDTVVAELLPGLPNLTIATALHGFDETQRDIFMRTMTFAQKRTIQDLFDSSKPTPAEIGATFQKILTETRRLINEGRLRLLEIDPEIVVPDDIEERLKKGPANPKPKLEAVASVAAEESTGVSETTNLNFDLAKNIGGAAPASGDSSRLEASLREENLALRRKMTTLANENGSLKQDIVRLQMKIDQIRKMAA